MKSLGNKSSGAPIRKSSDFSVAGIGASAGGLEALEQFFRNMPEKSGMAFVIVQHLDPNYKGMMPDLIRKVTKMKVVQVTDNLKIKPDTVYIIPPNRNMSVLNTKLHLFEFQDGHGLRLPINFFFHSLADDLGERSIGIILSGMGSDGTQGLQSIKDRGGLTLVQEPSTAEYDSMPKNAMASVHVDVVAPAGELPRKLLSALKRTMVPDTDVILDLEHKSSLEKIVLLIRSKTGHDFSQYKKTTVYRRLERRMMVHKIDHIASYVRYLQQNPGETEILFKEMLIGTTSFFRDPELWLNLKDNILTSIIKSKPEGYNLRLWIPACSTGEEAYSYAIILKEIIENLKPRKNITIQIFASDLDKGAVEKARRGIYNEVIAASVTSERLDRFFTKTGTSFKINNIIREMVVFAVHNIISDPPFTTVDLISCRNLLIYIEQDLQKRLLGVFHYCLKPDGILILGTSESTGSQSFLFDPVNARLRIFRKKDAEVSKMSDLPVVSSSKHHINEIQKPVKSIDNIQSLTDNLILQQHSPAGVLVNNDGDIIYLTRRSGKYLEPAAGKANMNIYSMLREEFSLEFPVAFRKAARSYDKVTLKDIKIKYDSSEQYVEVTIQQLEKPAALKGLILIVFRDIVSHDIQIKRSPGGKINARLMEIETERQRLKDDLQNTIEAMQVSEEELKSANEELQSTNEELQSTNEELTTSKEELQSMNEELQIVNLELMNKVDEFTSMSNDMKNLLESTEIATLFLTKDLKVRRFTSGVKNIFSLIEQDLGRPLSDLASELNYENFPEDLKEVLRTLVFIEKQIKTRSGLWYSVRIMPYRTADDKIDGLVITFSDITTTKKLESELNRTISNMKSETKS